MEVKDWLKQDAFSFERFYGEAQKEEKNLLAAMSEKEKHDYLISKVNYCQRKTSVSNLEQGVRIRKGDICFIDYGLSYVCEVAYQHFGLILSLVHGKAFVVPLGGNQKTLKRAKGKNNPQGKRHLMALGEVKGLSKSSVLFLNDAKWINTARIIDVKAHLNPKEALFQEIRRRIIELIV